MMDPNLPPTKPPRGIKTSKETSGLLMTIIRNQSKSESSDQRYREKVKLEKEYKKTDQQLNELVSTYDEDLTHVMQLFSNVSLAVTKSKERLSSVKNSLLACKSLLSCRRDELKKLWLEGVEHKHVLQLLGRIEDLKEVPSKLGNQLSGNQYLDATKQLVSALGMGDGALEGVEALTELRHELRIKKDNLYKHLLERLTQDIYLVSVSDIEKYRSEVNSNKCRTKWSSQAFKFNYDMRSEDQVCVIDGETVGTVTVLVECLGLLNKLSDASEYLKGGIKQEIFTVVSTISWTILSNPMESIHPLLDLINTLIQHLRKIADNLSRLLDCFNSTANKYKLNIKLFQLPDVWNSMQEVMQQVLNIYLDIQNTAVESHQGQLRSLNEHIPDISSYFNRRRTPRPRKFSFFRFEYSGSAASLNKAIQAQTSGPSVFGDVKHREKFLVTPPDPSNVTIIHIPLQKFITEIEAATGSSPCKLNTFVNDYIKAVFLVSEHSRIHAKVESIIKKFDVWRTLTSQQEAMELGLVRPIFQSTSEVFKLIEELLNLTETLPSHRQQILIGALGLVRNYRDSCQAAYRSVVQPGPEERQLHSAAWLKDEDISRFLKSLPNWLDLQAQKSHMRSEKSLKREDTVEEESPEDVRQRNIKEAEILASNLGDGGIGAHEIISDRLQLKCLAQMQESLEWFSWQLEQTVNKNKKLISASSSDQKQNILEQIKLISDIAREFEDHANKCLLVLHLEVRVQCFHYLLPRTVNGRVVINSNHNSVNSHSCKDDISQDPDPKVLELSRVLVSIDEVLSSSLQTRKTKYIFEGLGHLIAKILMSSTQFMERIDEAAIHKMCRNIFTLQQTLTNITLSREVALDHARSYFQLFFNSPEEILSYILEKGPQFTELEYMNAFQLISRNSLGDQNLLHKHLQRLSDILGEIGVTV